MRLTIIFICSGLGLRQRAMKRVNLVADAMGGGGDSNGYGGTGRGNYGTQASKSAYAPNVIT